MVAPLMIGAFIHNNKDRLNCLPAKDIITDVLLYLGYFHESRVSNSYVLKLF